MSTHVFQTIHGSIATVATALGLAACGGGGGSAPSVPLATNATQFAFNTAIANHVNNPATLPFTISGTGTTANQQAATLSGNGTLTHSTTASMFEGVAALKKTTVQTGTIRAVNVATGAIASQQLSTNGSEYFDTNYSPLGSTTASSYCVVATKSILPTSVRAGDTGNWYSLSCFTNALKTSKLWTSTITYSVETFDGTTALLKLNISITDTVGTTIGATTSYKMTSAGAITHYEDFGSNTLNGVTANQTTKY